MTHLINSILNTQIFPDVYKISRISPISKPGKTTDNVDHFRPINNLPAVEKLIESYFILHIEPHIKHNNILSPNHHGGRKKHSTTTALAIIYNKLLYNKENSIISTILCTDLSACYDTVDTDILIKKLAYYGFRGL